MSINSSYLLKSKIIAIYGTQYAFATSIGWHRNKVTALLKGQYVPDVNEALIISSTLSLSEKEILEIFYTRIHQIVTQWLYTPTAPRIPIPTTNSTVNNTGQ
ncbi:MAG: hypothetical protein RR219_06400 [Clostridiales bacterium]